MIFFRLIRFQKITFWTFQLKNARALTGNEIYDMWLLGKEALGPYFGPSLAWVSHFPPPVDTSSLLHHPLPHLLLLRLRLCLCSATSKPRPLIHPSLTYDILIYYYHPLFAFHSLFSFTPLTLLSHYLPLPNQPTQSYPLDSRSSSSPGTFSLHFFYHSTSQCCPGSDRTSPFSYPLYCRFTSYCFRLLCRCRLCFSPSCFCCVLLSNLNLSVLNV